MGCAGLSKGRAEQAQWSTWLACYSRKEAFAESASRTTEQGPRAPYGMGKGAVETAKYWGRGARQEAVGTTPEREHLRFGVERLIPFTLLKKEN